VCAPATLSGPDDHLSQLSNEQLVRRLLELTGAGRLGKQIADGMLENLRKMPNLPPEFMDRLKKNMHTEEVIELVVPIYLKQYDRDTLLAATTFYESDRGQTLVKGLPVVTAESMKVGQVWGTALAEKTLREMGLAPPPKP
jgi:hypothetical protein